MAYPEIELKGPDMRLALVAALTASPAFAATGEDAVSALQAHCLAPLEEGTALGEGLTRAVPEMEARLLDNKAARIFRTEDPSIVVVAHDSGETCEIMAIGTRPSDFDTAFRAWLGGQADYRINVEAAMGDVKPGGAYIARKVGEAYVQAFIQTHPESGFVGITASRVESSASADELFGE